MPSVKVIGVAGYSGSELARLLIIHPNLDSIQLIDRRAEEPTPLWKYRPNLRGTTQQMVTGKDDGLPADLVFFATPDGVTMELARSYLDRGIRVVDFSGDTRLRDPAIHKTFYGIEHKDPSLLKEAVYGLPELHREEIRTARVVANPGCYATSVALGIAPAVKAGLITPGSIIADCKSGVSGAGKHLSQRMHFAECDGNFNAYKVTGHKHIPEVEQELSLLAGQEVRISFVPHLLPVTRGILTTLYGELTSKLSAEDVQAVYEKAYSSEPFVRVLPGRGVHPQRGPGFQLPGYFRSCGQPQQPPHCDKCRGQPHQRRRRAGSPEHELNAGFRGNRGTHAGGDLVVEGTQWNASLHQA